MSAVAVGKDVKRKMETRRVLSDPVEREEEKRRP
jgi:hypothetical protein